MKNKSIGLVGILVVTVALGVVLVNLNKNKAMDKAPSKEAQQSTVPTVATEQIKQAQEANSQDLSSPATPSSTAPNTTTSTPTATPENNTGAYLTLADYNSKKASLESSKKIYFFHASWCPTCKSLDSALLSNGSSIPKNSTIIKTDFDTEKELKKKYGVTQQYTFVQINSDGSILKKWSATNLEEIITNIQ